MLTCRLVLRLKRSTIVPSTTSVPTIQFASNGILGNIGAPLRDFEDESEEALLGDFETDE